MFKLRIKKQLENRNYLFASKIDKNEIKRLKKALKEENPEKLLDWIKGFEEQIAFEYKKYFDKELVEFIDYYGIAMAYTLKFSELTNFGAKRFNSFMEDVMSTVDMYTTGEADPVEYMKELQKAGIKYYDKAIEEREEK